MTSIPGPVWHFVSPSVTRGTVGALLAGMEARGAKHDAYWQVGKAPAWSMARALATARLVGSVGLLERLARGASANAEKRSLVLSRPNARWRDEPWIRGPEASVHVITSSVLDDASTGVLASLDAAGQARAIRSVAAVVPVGALMAVQAPLVFAALATLEELAPNGLAWFNHEFLCDRTPGRRASETGASPLFATTGLTLAEVEHHEACGQGPFP